MQFDSDILLWVGVALLTMYWFALLHTREKQLASKSQELNFDPGNNLVDVSKLFRVVVERGIPVFAFNQQAIFQILNHSKLWDIAKLNLSTIPTTLPIEEMESALWQLIITLRGTTIENAVQIDVEYDFTSTLSSFAYRQQLFERLKRRMSADKTILPPHS